MTVRGYVRAGDRAGAAELLAELASGGAVALGGPDPLGEAWLAGEPVVREGGGRRVALPSYPFAGESHGAYRLGPVAPAGEQPEQGGGGGDLEQGVRALLAEALGLADADDPEMTYFAAGGDSLTAVHLVGCLRDDFDLDVPITLFLEQLTLHEMARRIVATGEGDDSLDALLSEFEAE